MATAAETQSIIQLVVGMVNAAPGADILAELEAMVDGGMTIEEMAIAITANPAWGGDTGLFPDYLPNAVFAGEFLTQLIGSEVTEDYLEEAVAEMTASLNAGDSRGAAINAAIDALAAADSADDDLGDAATALANKTEVATYYSVELGVSSDDLDVLKSIVEDVTSDEDAVEDGEAAADAIVADLQPLQLLINNLDDANTAVKTFLAAADGDGSAATTLTAADVDPGLLTLADLAVAPALMGVGAAGYAVGSDAVKDALIADDLVSNAIASGIQAKELAASLKAADAVTGLTAAHSIYLASLASKESADDAASIAAANLVAEIASYDVTDEAVTNNANVSFTTAGDGEIIGLNATATSLEIKPGFDEDSNPGITALLTAALINLGAGLGAIAAGSAITAAFNNVANLDVDAGGPRETFLSDMSTAMIARDVVVPALTGAPTPTEIALELAGLEALHEVLEDALDDIDPVTGGAADTDDEAFVTAVTAALDAAEAAGTITTLQNTNALATVVNDGAVFGEFDDATKVATAIVGVKAELDQAGGSLLFDFDTLVDDYELTIAGVPDGSTPLTLDVVDELTDSTVDALANAALAEAIADRETAKAAIDDLEVLTDAVDDAEAAFGDAGFGVPVTLGAIASATSADDVFLANDADSQILGFAGDDQLFLGDVDLVLNADTTAGDEGDNDVLEYWITGTTSAVITVETSEFGSEAADPETFTITLTGVAAADVTVTDGMLTIAS